MHLLAEEEKQFLLKRSYIISKVSRITVSSIDLSTLKAVNDNIDKNNKYNLYSRTMNKTFL